MDAVEFLKSYRQICDSNACTKCPLWVDEHYACMMDAKIIEAAQVDENRVVSAVEQWSKEHPVKTRQSEFLKILPTSMLDDNGVLYVKPCQIDGSVKADNDGHCPFMRCAKCRENYWLQKVE